MWIWSLQSVTSLWPNVLCSTKHNGPHVPDGLTLYLDVGWKWQKKYICWIIKYKKKCKKIKIIYIKIEHDTYISRILNKKSWREFFFASNKSYTCDKKTWFLLPLAMFYCRCQPESPVLLCPLELPNPWQ